MHKKEPSQRGLPSARVLFFVLSGLKGAVELAKEGESFGEVVLQEGE